MAALRDCLAAAGNIGQCPVPAMIASWWSHPIQTTNPRLWGLLRHAAEQGMEVRVVA
jgi:hypothetical protein